MIWLLIWLNNRQSASTGWIDHLFGYLCGSCGVQTQAMARVVGSSTAANVHQAYAQAQAIAFNRAGQAVHFAACPRCGRVQPQVSAALEKQQSEIARNRRLRLPISLGLAAIVFVLLAIPAVRDLRYSAALVVVAAGGALFVAAGVVAFFASPKHPILPATNSVWFWWQLPGHAPTWLPAPAPANVPPPPAKETLRLWGGLGGALFGLLSVLVGVIFWRASFSDLYVVVPNMTAVPTVRVDGNDATFEVNRPMTEAIAYGRIVVRGGRHSSHRLEVTDGSKGKTSIALPPSAHGWVVSPRGRERDLCLAEIDNVYGGGYTVSPTAPAMVDNRRDVVALPRAYDLWFAEAPKTQQVKSGQTKHVWSLRGVSCSAFVLNGEFETFTGTPAHRKYDESEGDDDAPPKDATDL